MTMFSEIYRLLTNTVSPLKVYPDRVPEGKPVPAVAYSNIGNVDDRMLSGDKSGNTQEWRVSIVVNKISELKPIIDQLESLDNTKTDDFSKIYVTLNNIESIDYDAVHRRAFIDITLYK